MSMLLVASTAEHCLEFAGTARSAGFIYTLGMGPIGLVQLALIIFDGLSVVVGIIDANDGSRL
jgi:threonine dehydrogenase-like Zn-dependent dehydrogenase